MSVRSSRPTRHASLTGLRATPRFLSGSVPPSTTFWVLTKLNNTDPNLVHGTQLLCQSGLSFLIHLPIRASLRLIPRVVGLPAKDGESRVDATNSLTSPRHETQQLMFIAEPLNHPILRKPPSTASQTTQGFSGESERDISDLLLLHLIPASSPSPIQARKDMVRGHEGVYLHMFTLTNVPSPGTR